MENSIVIKKNSVGDTRKKSSWLTNSSYIPVQLIEYAAEEVKKDPNYDEILESDSGEDSIHVTYKKHKHKKRHHKKPKKKHIIKSYLKGIESIDSENCKFKKMIFVEEVPRNERFDAFFLDLRGNPYISHYGSICEKHVPKYRIKKKPSMSEVISDRYYMSLKKLASEKNRPPIERKNCDSHCTCQQYFIPVPYDIVTDTNEEERSNDQDMINEVASINEMINKDPHNIEAWLSLITVQNKANQMGVSNSVATSIVVEKRLMIIERALTKNQSNLQLHLMRMQLGGEVWPVDKLQKEWNQVLFVWNTNIDVWRFYIDQIAKKTLGFSVDKIVTIYTKCFSTFFNVMSGRMKTKTIDSETVMDLCDLFSDYCEYLAQSGYRERALASWQAVLEYNLFCGSFVPKQSGNILDDPMLKSLEEYWCKSTKHIGQPECEEWVNNGMAGVGGEPCKVQMLLEAHVSEQEERLLADKNLDESHMWLGLEKVRCSAWWLPYTGQEDTEDPDRQVSFPLIQSSLVTVHGPCNLSPQSGPAPVVSRKAKQRLILLFLDSIGVCDPEVSKKYTLSASAIRRQQLSLSYTTRLYVSTASGPARRNLLEIATRCLEQVRPLFSDDGGAWRDDMAILELSSHIHGVHLVKEDWKEALSGIRSVARQVMARPGTGTDVWMSYVATLMSLTVHKLWLGKDKATKALVAEVAKVVQALVTQDTSTSTDQRLRVLSLSLDLARHQGASPHSAKVMKIIEEATYILANQHSLGKSQAIVPPSLPSLSLLLTEITTYTHTTTHWHWTLYYRAIATLLLVDTQPYITWMTSECLPIVMSIGSKHNFCPTFSYQLSQFLELTSAFFAWFLRCRDLNESAHVQSVLGPFVRSLTEIQSKSDTPIIDLVFSPSLIETAMGQRSLSSCQKLGLKNFLWSVIGACDLDTKTSFNYVCHGSSLLLLDMELKRWSSVRTDFGGIETEMFSGRADRVRSTFNRLLGLRCMYWRHRLALWLALMRFESEESGAQRDERTKAVFYRAVTEMPGQKSLYLCVAGLVPSMVEEVVTVMKNNGVRLCVPIEEAKLLLRIRDSAMGDEDAL